MNQLIDSHALIWSYFDPGQLSPNAKKAMTDPTHRIFVSPASYWEIAIKISIGKLQIAEPFLDFVQHAVIDNGFAFLPLEPRHAAELIGLAHHHRDPFDRLLVAQAIAENMEVNSNDQMLDRYAIRRIW